MSLTHFDDKGRAHMVDVSDKAETDRIAVAVEHSAIDGECNERSVGGAAAGQVGQAAIGCAVVRAEIGGDAVFGRIGDAMREG